MFVCLYVFKLYITIILERFFTTPSPQIQKTPLSLRNYYICCQEEMKLYTLLSLLRQEKDGKKMVFVSTCAAVEYLGKLITTIFKNTKVVGNYDRALPLVQQLELAITVVLQIN